MYYQFDSRLSMPAILFDDDRIVVAGKEYDYAELNDIEITKAPQGASGPYAVDKQIYNPITNTIDVKRVALTGFKSSSDSNETVLIKDYDIVDRKEYYF
jgi:hypothetical protein